MALGGAGDSASVLVATTGWTVCGNGLASFGDFLSWMARFLGGEKLGSQCAVGCFCDGGWFGCRCRRGDMGDRLRGLGCLDFLLCGWGKE